MSTFDDQYSALSLAEWENYPSIKTALAQVNLNKINKGLKILYEGLAFESRDKVPNLTYTADKQELQNDINSRVKQTDYDNKVRELEAEDTRLNTVKQEAQGTLSWLKDLDFNPDTGVFTITRVDNSQYTIDTNIEKIAINFDYDKKTQKLLLYSDVEKSKLLARIDLSSLISEYEFEETDTIGFYTEYQTDILEGDIGEALADGKIKPYVKDHSIGPDQLQIDYLADIQEAQSAAWNHEAAANGSAKSAELNAQEAARYNSLAEERATTARSYAVGGTGTRMGEDTDNARYYSEIARHAAESVQPTFVEYINEVEDGIKIGDLLVNGDPTEIVIPRGGTDALFPDIKGVRMNNPNNVSAYGSVAEGGYMIRSAPSMQIISKEGTTYHIQTNTAYSSYFKPPGVKLVFEGKAYKIENVFVDKTENILTFTLDTEDDITNTLRLFEFAIPYENEAKGLSSHAEGYDTKAHGNYSHAEGSGTYTESENCHAEGHETKAIGDTSHAEGYYTKANGEDSHAEGYYTEANAMYSHAEGYYTKANGKASHAEGCYTEAYRDYQTVVGKYNEIIDDKSLFTVGNGTSKSGSNAFNVLESGDVKVGNNIISDNGMGLYYAIINTDKPAYGSGNSFNLKIPDFKTPCILSIELSDDNEYDYVSFSYNGLFINNKKCVLVHITEGTPNNGVGDTLILYRKNYSGYSYGKNIILYVTDNQYGTEFDYQGFSLKGYYRTPSSSSLPNITSACLYYPYRVPLASGAIQSKGVISDTTGVEITLGTNFTDNVSSPSTKTDAGTYILITHEFNTSNKAYRGHHAYLLAVPSDSAATKTVQQINLAASTNNGATITRPTNSHTIKIAAASGYTVYYTLYTI